MMMPPSIRIDTQKAESGDAIRDFEAAWRVSAKGTSIGRSLLLA
jgi:hypothetical protein